MTPDYFQLANIQDVMRYTKKWPPARGQRDGMLKSTGKLKGSLFLDWDYKTDFMVSCAMTYLVNGTDV